MIETFGRIRRGHYATFFGIAVSLYVFLQFSGSSRMGMQTPVVHVDEWHKTDDLQNTMKMQMGELLAPTLGSEDWGRMGRRVAALGHWAELLKGQPSLTWEPFLDLLHEQFPWWTNKSSGFTPWGSMSENQNATALVTCVGPDNVQTAAHLIVTLRNVLKSQIPIQIAFVGDLDLPVEEQQYLRDLAQDVQMLNLEEHFDEDLVSLGSGRWAAKPFAMLASSYSRTILVDADTIFLQNPDDIFTTNPGLASTGTLFFRDRLAPESDERRDWVLSQLQLAGSKPSKTLNSSLFMLGKTSYELEAGVVCVDKSRPRVFLAMMFAAWMNARDNRDNFTYQKFYGDKETYWLATEFAGVPYFFEPQYSGQIGVLRKQIDGQPPSNITEAILRDVPLEICGTHMMHMDSSGTRPLWVNGGLWEDKRAIWDGFSTWTHFWIGGIGPDEQGDWKWMTGTKLCIRTGPFHEIDLEMRETIEAMIREAKNLEENIT